MSVKEINLSPLVLVTPLSPEELESYSVKYTAKHDFGKEKEKKEKRENPNCSYSVMYRNKIRKKECVLPPSNGIELKTITNKNILNVEKGSQHLNQQPLELSVLSNLDANQVNMCRDVISSSNIEILADPTIGHESKKDKEIKLKIEQKPFIGVINSFKQIKDETKDDIYKAIKTEFKEFAKSFDKRVKFETLRDSNYEPKEGEELENDDINSEIQVIQEIKEIWVKIERTEQVIGKKNYEFKRSEGIDALISENKDQTIPVKGVQNTSRTPMHKHNFHQNETFNTNETYLGSKDKRNDCRSGKVSKIKALKVKPPQALGIIKNGDNEVTLDCRTKLMKYTQLRKGNESKIEEICLLYTRYFNNHAESFLINLIKLLHSILKELSDGYKTLNGTPSSIEDIQFDNGLSMSLLKKYSKQFVETFNAIINLFEENHKIQMIPIIYLRLLKETEHVTSVKQEDVRSIILRIFIIEEYNSKYDMICNKNHVESKRVLSIYERWLAKFLAKENWTETKSLHDNTVEREGAGKVIEPTNTSPLVIDLSDSEELDCNKQISDKCDFGMYLGVNNDEESESLVRDTEEQTTLDCEFQDSAFLLDCPNETCGKKLTIPCCFCFEYFCCTNKCQVENDQLAVGPFVSCKEHKSFIPCWSDNNTKDWYKFEDHQMPHEPQCWSSCCGKKALLTCQCKARGYCSLICRDDDWYSNHYKTCTRHTDLDLFYKHTC